MYTVDVYVISRVLRQMQLMQIVRLQRERSKVRNAIDICDIPTNDSDQG